MRLYNNCSGELRNGIFLAPHCRRKFRYAKLKYISSKKHDYAVKLVIQNVINIFFFDGLYLSAYEEKLINSTLLSKLFLFVCFSRADEIAA